MAVSYNNLWKLLIDMKLRKTVFAEKVGISKSTLAKLGNDKHVAMEVIERICINLNCMPNDILEFTPDMNRRDVSE